MEPTSTEEQATDLDTQISIISAITKQLTKSLSANSQNQPKNNQPEDGSQHRKKNKPKYAHLDMFYNFH